MNNERVASELVNLAKAIAAGCEKLPAGPMRDNCEKKKEEGKGKKEAREPRRAGRVNIYKMLDMIWYEAYQKVEEGARNEWPSQGADKEFLSLITKAKSVLKKNGITDWDMSL